MERSRERIVRHQLQGGGQPSYRLRSGTDGTRDVVHRNAGREVLGQVVNEYSDDSQRGVPTPIVENNHRPIATIAVPATGHILYRPSS